MLKIEFPEYSPNLDGEMDRWSTSIAKFESETKEDYEWKRTKLIKPNEIVEIDAHDHQTWIRSTVFKTDT